MKKNKLKNYVKMGIFLFGISLLLQNCEKEEIIPLEHQTEALEENNTKTITFKNLKNTGIYQYFDAKNQLSLVTDKNLDLQQKNGLSNEITIRTKKIHQIIKNGYQTYSMLLEYKEKQENIYYNLVLHKKGNKYYMYTLKLDNSKKLLGKGDSFDLAPTNVTALPGLVPIDSWDGWEGEDDNSSDNPLYECLDITVTTEHSCTGAGHWVGENCLCGTHPDFTCTRAYIEQTTTRVCVLIGEGDNYDNNNNGDDPKGSGGNPTNPNEVETVKPPFTCPDGQVKDSTGKCQDKKKPCIGNPVINPEIAPQEGPSGTKGALFGNAQLGGCTRYGSNACNTPRNKKHDGIDIKNTIGNNVHVMNSGFVYSSGYSNDYGYYAIIQSTINGKTILTTYAHMQKNNRIEQNKSGQPLVKVKAGDILGLQGDTGNIKQAIKKGAVEPHVHIEIKEHDGSSKWSFKKNFNLVDPRTYLSTTIDNNGVSQTNINCN